MRHSRDYRVTLTGIPLVSQTMATQTPMLDMAQALLSLVLRESTDWTVFLGQRQ